MADNTNDLLSRLREPLWSHGNFAFESPQLAKDETVADLKAAADEIERLTGLGRMELHRHFYIPKGYMLKAVGDLIVIEPWRPEIHGKDEPLDTEGNDHD